MGIKSSDVLTVQSPDLREFPTCRNLSEATGRRMWVITANTFEMLIIIPFSIFTLDSLSQLGSDSCERMSETSTESPALPSYFKTCEL